MGNLIDKLKSWITPPPSSAISKADSLRELRGKTKLLEQQADYAEAEAKLQERSAKAKKRIKATRKSNLRPLYIIAGLVLLAIIILVVSGSC